MKRYTQILGLCAAVLFFTSCADLLKKEIEPVSQVSVKPYVKLLGEPIMSITKGTAYVEHGAQGSTISEDGSELNYNITAGEVNPNENGFYAVEYFVANEFGWGRYTYRAVLVYEGEAYGTDDISGKYEKGFQNKAAVTKNSITGYWEMDDVWVGTTLMPIIFADNKDGTYGIVPGVHEEKGQYSGTIEVTPTRLTYYITLLSEDGTPLKFSDYWIRK